MHLPLFPQLFSPLGSFVFAFQGQSVMLEVMREMKDPNEFTKSLVAANSLMILVYAGKILRTCCSVDCCARIMTAALVRHRDFCVRYVRKSNLEFSASFVGEGFGACRLYWPLASIPHYGFIPSNRHAKS